MVDASTAYTLAAPACTAKKERIPEPAPTSKTTLSWIQQIYDYFIGMTFLSVNYSEVIHIW